MQQFKIEAKQTPMLLLIFFAILLYILTGFILLTQPDPAKKGSNALFYQQQWSVTLNGEPLPGANSHQIYLPFLHAGDVLALQTSGKLPARGTGIFLRSGHAEIQAFCGSELLYEYGQERASNHLMTGSGYHLIPFSATNSHEPVTILLRITEDSVFFPVSAVVVDHVHSPFLLLVRSNLFSLLIGCFLLVFGFIVMLASFLLVFWKNSFFDVFWLALLSVFTGVWILAIHGLLQLFSSNLVLNTYLEYDALYFLPFPFFMLIDSITDKMRTRGFYWMLGLHTGFTLLVYTLHLCNIVHLPTFLPLFLLLALGYIIYCAVLLRQYAQTALPRRRLLWWGGLSSMALLILFVFIFHLYHEIFYLPLNIFDALATFLPMLFIFFMAGNYAVHFVSKYSNAAEKRLLMRLAYEDPLTGVYNRQKAVDELEQMDRTGKSYALLYIDLDRLKYTNDTYGHAAGDLLLQRFSSAMLDFFGRENLCIRLGGDEFLVILAETHSTDAKALWEQFYKKLKEQNPATETDGSTVALEASCGVADSTEVPNYIEGLLLADQRMYADKAQRSQRTTCHETLAE